MYPAESFSKIQHDRIGTLVANEILDMSKLKQVIFWAQMVK